MPNKSTIVNTDTRDKENSYSVGENNKKFFGVTMKKLLIIMKLQEVI